MHPHATNEQRSEVMGRFNNQWRQELATQSKEDWLNGLRSTHVPEAANALRKIEKAALNRQTELAEPRENLKNKKRPTRRYLFPCFTDQMVARRSQQLIARMYLGVAPTRDAHTGDLFPDRMDRRLLIDDDYPYPPVKRKTEERVTFDPTAIADPLFREAAESEWLEARSLDDLREKRLQQLRERRVRRQEGDEVLQKEIRRRAQIEQVQREALHQAAQAGYRVLRPQVLQHKVRRHWQRRRQRALQQLGSPALPAETPLPLSESAVNALEAGARKLLRTLYGDCVSAARNRQDVRWGDYPRDLRKEEPQPRALLAQREQHLRSDDARADAPIVEFDYAAQAATNVAAESVGQSGGAGVAQMKEEVGMLPEMDADLLAPPDTDSDSSDDDDDDVADRDAPGSARPKSAAPDTLAVEDKRRMYRRSSILQRLHVQLAAHNNDQVCL
ncbi:MAG: hypothetical protein MHM6MM_000154 [Cercozoa sp. M6MM]